jgi:hypothetical protein
MNTDFVNKLNRMENYIYLCWVHLFSITLHDLDNNEKPYRFQQLVDVIKRLNWIDVIILNI